MTRRRAVVLATVCAVALLAIAPEAALAHGLVGKQDLPIPRWLFAWAAAVVLVASFVGLAVLWPKPRLADAGETRRFRVPAAPFFDAALGALGVAFFAFMVYAGFDGTQTASANLVPTTVYVLFWVGLAFASVLFGDVFRAINPWLAVARFFSWVTGRLGRDGGEGSEPLPYPAWLGRWPAALGILAFAWVELSYTSRDDPSILATLALAYAAVQLVGMTVYGIDPWTRYADAFSVYFGLFARLSAFRWERGIVYTRPFLSGVPTLDIVPGTVALLCTMIGTTSFDGFSQGRAWTSLAPDIQGRFIDIGLTQEQALEGAYTVGLVSAVLIVSLLYRLGVEGMRTVDRRHSAKELAGAFAHTLVPISLAYVVAHYFSLLAYQGQAVAYLASDPLGTGHDYFGTADKTIDYSVLTANAVWYVQVGALLFGHVSGLILAHDRALTIYRKARDATRSQYWMLAVMVAFTSLGLWLLSAAAQ